MDFRTDISASLAVSAFSGTSFSPEKRAENTITEYAQTLQADYELFAKHADLGGTLDMLAAEFEQYRQGYAKRYRAWLHSRSNCISAMITGPSNFPLRRAEKRNNIEHKRCDELLSFRERARKAVISKLRPDLAPIMAGDSNAVERLRAELASLKATQAHMKAVNAAHKAFLKNPASLDKAQFPESTKNTIRNYKPAYSWEPHPFAPYQLSNHSANIRRVEKRIETLSAAKAAPVIEREGANARLEDDPPANRIRIFFPGKPDEQIRAQLKRNGFRWSPTIGAWQAYRNHHSIELAKQLAA